MALLCGIGFTMSLFIGLLAFADAPLLQEEVKVGILGGSLVAGLLGWSVLRVAPPRRASVRTDRTVGLSPAVSIQRAAGPQVGLRS